MAGSNAIASGSVILTANADGLKASLDRAAQHVGTWGQGVAASLSNAFNAKGGALGGLQHIGGAVTGKLAGLASAAKGLLSGAGTAIGTMLGGPIGGAIGAAVGSAVGALGETVVGALGAPFEKLDLFAGIVKQSASLGISASQFQGLTAVMGMAGIEGDHVGQTFAVMGKQISDVAAGKGKGAALAFEKLGLSAAELMAMKPDQQFLAIADAFKKMPAGADQASAAVHLFGGNAAAMLPLLQRGGAGIGDLIGSMKKTGAVLSDDQLQAAANASKAWKSAKRDIKSAWDGLANRATLIAAPVIEFIAKAVSKGFALLAPVFDWVGRAVGKVADIVTAVFEQLMTWFDAGVAAVKAFGAEWLSFGGEMPTVEEMIVSVFRAVGVTAAYAWDAVKLGAGVIAYVAGAILESGGSILSMFRALTDLVKELPDDVRPKWVDDMVAGVAKADDAVKAFGGKMKDWGKGAMGGFGKSAADFNKWLDDALKAKKAGGEMGKALVDGLGEAVADAAPVKLSGAMLRGSMEAYSLVVKNRLSGIATQDEPIKGVLNEAKKANAHHKNVDKNTKKSADILDGLGAV